MSDTEPTVAPSEEKEVQANGGQPEGPPPKGPTEQEAEEEEEKEEEEEAGPEDVACDWCLGAPRRALKSCLTCLASFCGAHLRNHLEKARFRDHRLVEPLRDLERRTCEGHRRPLELYCHADRSCLCRECLEEQHKGHNTAPIEEARRQIERELKERRIETVVMATAAENAVDKLERNTVAIQKSVREVQEVIREQFLELQAEVRRAEREVTAILENEEQQAIRQADGIRLHLQQRSNDLRRTQERLDGICSCTQPLHFLQEYSEWKKEATDVSLPGVYIGLMDRLHSFSKVVISTTQDLCARLVNSYLTKVKDTDRSDKVGIKTTVHQLTAANQSLRLPDPVTRQDFLKYGVQLTFDPDTAHKFLRLTDDNRKATNTTPWQHAYPDIPARFLARRQVLATQSLYMGRHYFEVEAGGEGAHVGLTYASIERRGGDSDGCLGANDFSWSLCWNGRAYTACHRGVETPLPAMEVPGRLGVYVDYARGLLEFHAVEASMKLIQRYQAHFLEPLYPAFWLPKKENTVMLIAPGEPLVPVTKANATAAVTSPTVATPTAASQTDATKTTAGPSSCSANPNSPTAANPTSAKLTTSRANPASPSSANPAAANQNAANPNTANSIASSATAASSSAAANS